MYAHARDGLRRAALWAMPILAADARLTASYQSWWFTRNMARLRTVTLRQTIPQAIIAAIYVVIMTAVLDVQEATSLTVTVAITALARVGFGLLLAYLPQSFWTYDRLSCIGTISGVVGAGAMFWASVNSRFAVVLPTPVLMVLYMYSAPNIGCATTSTFAIMWLVPPTITLLQPLLSLARVVWVEVHLLNTVLLYGLFLLGWYTVRQQETAWLCHCRTMLALEDEERQSNEVLSRLLPRPLIAELTACGYQGQRFAAAHNEAGVLCVRLPDNLSAPLPAAALVALTNSLWATFDRLTRAAGLYGVQAAGSIFLAAAGVAESEPDTEHMPRLARLALSMTRALAGSMLAAAGGRPLRVAMALDAGRVQGGVIGLRAPHYRVWGEAVSRVHELNAACSAGDIIMTETARNLLQAWDPAGLEFAVSPGRPVVLSAGREPISVYQLRDAAPMPVTPEHRGVLWDGGAIDGGGPASPARSRSARQASVKAVFRHDYTAALAAAEQAAEPQSPSRMVTGGTRATSSMDRGTASASEAAMPPANRSSMSLDLPVDRAMLDEPKWPPRGNSCEAPDTPATPRNGGVRNSVVEEPDTSFGSQSVGGPTARSRGGAQWSLNLDAVLETLLRRDRAYRDNANLTRSVVASFRIHETFRVFNSGGTSLQKWTLAFVNPTLEHAYAKQRLTALVAISWPVMFSWHVLITIGAVWVWAAFSGDDAMWHVMQMAAADHAHDGLHEHMRIGTVANASTAAQHTAMLPLSTFTTLGTNIEPAFFYSPLAIALYVGGTVMFGANLLVMEAARARPRARSRDWDMSIRDLFRGAGSWIQPAAARRSESSDATGRNVRDSSSTVVASASRSSGRDVRGSLRNDMRVRQDERLRRTAQAILPYSLPILYALLTMAMSLWTFQSHAAFATSTLLMLILSMSAVRLLCTSWLMIGVLMWATLLAHVLLVIVEAVTKSAAEDAPWDEDMMPQRAIITEVVLSLVLACLHNCVYLTHDAMRTEVEDREDFLTEIKAKLRRNLTESIVEARLPPPVVSELRYFLANDLFLQAGWRMPRVSVLVASVAGFAKLAAHASPEDVCTILHELNAAFNQLLEVDEFSGEVYRIDGSTDAATYVVAAGCVANGSSMPEQDASNLAKLALRMLEAVEAYTAPRPLDGSASLGGQTGAVPRVRLRVALHSGPADAVIGAWPFFSYGLLGDLLPEAKRLERRSIPGRVRASAAFVAQLCPTNELDAEGAPWDPEFRLADAGPVALNADGDGKSDGSSPIDGDMSFHSTAGSRTVAAAAADAAAAPGKPDPPQGEPKPSTVSPAALPEAPAATQASAPPATHTSVVPLTPADASPSYWLTYRFLDARPPGLSAHELYQSRLRSGNGDVLAAIF